MRRLDKRLEWRLWWLMAPLFVVFVLFTGDICFEWNLNSLSWIMPALAVCFLIPLLGFSIAYIKYKCWGLLAITVAITVVMLLNMSNYFVDLLLK